MSRDPRHPPPSAWWALLALLLLIAGLLTPSTVTADAATATDPRTVLEGSRFTALTPSRLLDTRSGVGAPVGPLTAGATLDLTVTGRGGVPASDVTAVVLNVTATQPSAASYLKVWPTGIARPNVSSLNFVAGQTIPNLVKVKVGTGGKVSFYNPTGTVHVIAYNDLGQLDRVLAAHATQASCSSRPSVQICSDNFSELGLPVCRPGSRAHAWPVWPRTFSESPRS